MTKLDGAGLNILRFLATVKQASNGDVDKASPETSTTDDMNTVWEELVPGGYVEIVERNIAITQSGRDALSVPAHQSMLAAFDVLIAKKIADREAEEAAIKKRFADAGLAQTSGVTSTGGATL